VTNDNNAKTQKKAIMQRSQFNFLRTTSKHHLLVGAWVCVLLVIMGLFFSLWQEASHQLDHLLARNERYQAQVAHLKQSVEADKLFLEAAFQDPSVIEWLARKQLGYVKEGECLFCFK
jgi:cell division protein FtsB